MYKLKDNQGTDTFSEHLFNTKEEVRDSLINFHEPDLEKGVVYELEDLLEIGDWELLEMPEGAMDEEWDNK